jgi:hypothetical protein
MATEPPLLHCCSFQGQGLWNRWQHRSHTHQAVQAVPAQSEPHLHCAKQLCGRVRHVPITQADMRQGSKRNMLALQRYNAG